MAVPPTSVRAARDLLAKNVRLLRQERGLTQEALADAIGLRQAQVSEVEAGKSNIVLDGLIAIAHGLGVPVARLFGG